MSDTANDTAEIQKVIVRIQKLFARGGKDGGATRGASEAHRARLAELSRSLGALAVSITVSDPPPAPVSTCGPATRPAH